MYYYIIVLQPVPSIMATVTNDEVYSIVVKWEVCLMDQIEDTYPLKIYFL